MDRETADDIKRHFDVVAEELRSEIGGVRSEIGGLRREIGGVRSEIGSVAHDLRSEIQDVRQYAEVVAESLRVEIQDVKRHSDVVAESLGGEIRLVAEGVAGLDEKFTQEFVKVREEIREQVGDVKSLLRLTYVDLDRRVQVLERKPPV